MLRDPMILTLLGLALAAVAGLGVLLVVVYHKLSLAIDRLRKELPRESANVFAQLEALAGVHLALRLDHPLPATRGWAASPDYLLVIVTHMLKARPSQVVECGSGVSTVALARCAQLLGGGHVHSLEHDLSFAVQTRQELTQRGLSSFATVHDAPLTETVLPNWAGPWYAHDTLPPDLRIDMLVVDGPPEAVAALARYPALPILFSRLKPAAMVFLDDAARESEQATVRRWLNEYAQLKAVQSPLCEKGCAALTRSA